MSDWTHYRAQVATLTRSRANDDPELVEARRNLRAARLTDHVTKIVAGAPPLSDAQKLSVVRALMGGESRAS